MIKVPPRTMKLAEKNYDRERKLAEAVVADRAFALSQVAHGCLQSTIFEAEGFDISVLAPASAPKGAQRHQATPADIERPAAIGRPLRPAVALEGATVYPSQTNDIQCSLLTPLPPILPPIRCSSRQGSSTMASAPALLTPKPAHAPAPAPAPKQFVITGRSKIRKRSAEWKPLLRTALRTALFRIKSGHHHSRSCHMQQQGRLLRRHCYSMVCS